MDGCYGGGAIKQKRILVIESDEAAAQVEVFALEKAGYSVVRGVDILDGLKKLYQLYPDLIIMGRELANFDSEDPCLRIRHASYLPLIVIGSRERTAETLELGADAYIEKPPSLIELVARVRALLRRLQSTNLSGGNPRRPGETYLPKSENGLTRTEYRVASCLMLNEGRLVDNQRLISEVWGGKRVSLANLHFFMRSLCQKLASGRISGMRGFGYCFEGQAEPYG